MRQNFTPQELAEHFTLLPAEQELLANKTGANRLGFVVLFKYFQWEGRFPEHVQDVPRAVVDHIARTLTIPGERYLQYDLEGRSARYHKEQIRQWTGFRVGTTADADAITTWLCAHTRVDEATPARLTVQALERYKALHIEPPTPGRLERMTHAAQRTLEEQFFTALAEALKPGVFCISPRRGIFQKNVRRMAAYAILEVFDMTSFWKLCEHHSRRRERGHKSQHVSLSEHVLP